MVMHKYELYVVDGQCDSTYELKADNEQDAIKEAVVLIYGGKFGSVEIGSEALIECPIFRETVELMVVKRVEEVKALDRESLTFLYENMIRDFLGGKIKYE